MSTRYKRTNWVRRLEDFSSGCSSGFGLGQCLIAGILAIFSGISRLLPVTRWLSVTLSPDVPVVSTTGASSLKSPASIWRGVVFIALLVGMMAMGRGAWAEPFFIDSEQYLGDAGNTDIALGDLDGDGDIDAVVTSLDGNQVWQNIGGGKFTNGEYLGDYKSHGIALEDLDNDGDLDVFIANYGANKVWLNNGNNSGYFTNYSDSQDIGNANSNDVALGDLDGDGDIDAFIANRGPIISGAANKVWLNDGTGYFVNNGQNLGDFVSSSAALADIDSDGDLDSFVTNEFDKPNKVWLNDGTGNFTDSGQNIGNSTSRDIAFGDLDGDSDIDAFVTNMRGSKVWLNDGTGQFTNSGQNLDGSNNQAVALGDVDNDGDLDALVSGNKLWLNDGNSNFTENQEDFLNAQDTWGIGLGDIDNDGDLDAFFAIYTPVNTIWLNQLIPQSEEPVEEPLNQCPLVSYSAFDRKITFDMLAMELYNPITDKPNGQFALFTGTDLSLEAFPGFYDFKYEGSELTYADQIVEESDNCYPTYSAQEEIVHFPKVEVPLVSILPNGKSVDGFSVCYEAFLKQANTQDMVFTLTQTNEISCDAGSIGAVSCELTVDNTNEDIQVNTYSNEDQSFPSISDLEEGGWVITWSSSEHLLDNDSWGVYMQRYDSCGKKVGEETLVNTTTTANQWLSSATTLQDGSYIIFWHGQHAANPGIYMQSYSANGEKQGSEVLFVANDGDGRYRNEFSVSTMSNGGFIMAWHVDTKKEIRIQRYNNHSEKVGNEITIAGDEVEGEDSNNLQTHPAITVLQDDSWVVAWHKSIFPDNLNQNGIYMQHYDANGNPQGINKIDSYPNMNWYKPELVALQDGGWLVSILHDGDPRGVNLQHYDSNGTKVSDELIATNHHFGPGMLSSSIIELQNGDWVVAWGSIGYPDAYHSGAYLQRFNNNGEKVGDEIRANNYLTSHDFPSSMAPLPDGGLVVTWSSIGQDGDFGGIYMKRYDGEGNVVK